MIIPHKVRKIKSEVQKKWISKTCSLKKHYLDTQMLRIASVFGWSYHIFNVDSHVIEIVLVQG